MRLLPFASKVDVTPVTLGAWVTVTAPAALDGLDSVIVEVVKTAFSGVLFGVRSTVSAETPKIIENDSLCVLYVALDASRQFQVYAGSAEAVFKISGGFAAASATVFATSATSKNTTPTATNGTLETVDISAYTGADDPLAAIVYAVHGGSIAEMKFSDSVGGTTTAGIISGQTSLAFLVPATNSQILLGRSTSFLSYYLLGYIKSGITKAVPPIQYTPTAANVWESVNTTANIPVGHDIAIASIMIGFATGAMGLRQVGDTNISPYNAEATQVPLLLNASNQFEVYSPRTDFCRPVVDFWAVNSIVTGPNYTQRKGSTFDATHTLGTITTATLNAVNVFDHVSSQAAGTISFTGAITDERTTSGVVDLVLGDGAATQTQTVQVNVFGVVPSNNPAQKDGAALASLTGIQIRITAGANLNGTQVYYSGTETTNASGNFSTLDVSTSAAVAADPVRMQVLTAAGDSITSAETVGLI
jgi:hypothetical protein